MSYKHSLRNLLATEAHDLQRQGYGVFAITLTYKNSGRYNLPLDMTQSVVEGVRKALTRHLVHRQNYDRPKYRHLTPTFHVAPEQKAGNGQWHHHGILAVHPDLQEKAIALVGTNTLLSMHRQLLTTDVREAYDIDGWIEYMVPNGTAANELYYFSPRPGMRLRPAVAG